MLAELVTSWKGPMLEQLMKKCSRGKDSHWRKLGKIVSHDRDPKLDHGKSVRKKEWQREYMMN